MSNVAQLMPHGECVKCGGARDERSPNQGRYAKQCESCRKETAAAISGQSRRPDPKAGVDLGKVVQDAVVPARAFQKAVEKRDTARRDAQAALGELNAALNRIREAAQRVASASNHSAARVDRELEEETAP